MANQSMCLHFGFGQMRPIISFFKASLFIYLLFQHSMLALGQNSFVSHAQVDECTVAPDFLCQAKKPLSQQQNNRHCRNKDSNENKKAIVDRIGRTMLFIGKINNFWLSIMGFMHNYITAISKFRFDTMHPFDFPFLRRINISPRHTTNSLASYSFNHVPQNTSVVKNRCFGCWIPPHKE